MTHIDPIIMCLTIFRNSCAKSLTQKLKDWKSTHDPQICVVSNLTIAMVWMAKLETLGPFEAEVKEANEKAARTVKRASPLG